MATSCQESIVLGTIALDSWESIIHGTAYVSVGRNKEGGVGHVLDYSGDGTFNIKYVLNGRVERNVRFGRVKSLNPLSLSACCTASNQLQQLSILSPFNQPQT